MKDFLEFINEEEKQCECVDNCTCDECGCEDECTCEKNEKLSQFDEFFKEK